MDIHAVVTGGAGFIGSHLVDRLLSDGHRVTIIDNLSTGRMDNLAHLQGHPSLRFVKADVCDLDTIRPYFRGAKWVFHLAALADIVPSIERPSEYFRSNVDGTFAVLECCRLEGVARTIYAASSSCYGIPSTYPTAEDAPIDTHYPYAFTKNLGEQNLFHWSKIYKMPAVSLRFFNVYGPRSRTSGAYGAMFGVFLAQKLKGAPFTVVGDGEQSRDFIYVTDVADALVRAAESSISGRAFNVGTGNPVTVNRITELLGGAKVYVPKRPGEPDRTMADISAIRSEFGWSPKIGIEEGVKRMLALIDKWSDAPVWTPESIAEATATWFKFLDGGKK